MNDARYCLVDKDFYLNIYLKFGSFSHKKDWLIKSKHETNTVKMERLNVTLPVENMVLINDVDNMCLLITIVEKMLPLKSERFKLL